MVDRTQSYDSNLFRLPGTADAIAVPSASERSEQIGITTASLSIDKAYSLQRVALNVNVVDHHYRNFNYLSFTALNYAAAWQWSLTPRVRGVLSSTRYESPTSYQDFKGLNTRNVHTDRVTRLEAEADLGSSWRVVGGLDHTNSMDENFVIREGDARVQGAALGLRYVFASTSHLSFQVRRNTGDSIGLGESAFVESAKFDDAIRELELLWNFSAKTKLNARLGHLERHYAQLAGRDFNGLNGEVGLRWDATAKSGVEISARRTLAPYQVSTSNYIKTDRLAISPVWKASAHIKVRARYEFAYRDFDGVAPGRDMAFGRQDVYRVASLGVDWQLLRAVTLSLSLSKIKNDSNVYGAGYEANGARVSAQINF